MQEDESSLEPYDKRYSLGLKKFFGNVLRVLGKNFPKFLSLTLLPFWLLVPALAIAIVRAKIPNPDIALAITVVLIAYGTFLFFACISLLFHTFNDQNLAFTKIVKTSLKSTLPFMWGYVIGILIIISYAILFAAIIAVPLYFANLAYPLPDNLKYWLPTFFGIIPALILGANITILGAIVVSEKKYGIEALLISRQYFEEDLWRLISYNIFCIAIFAIVLTPILIALNIIFQTPEVTIPIIAWFIILPLLATQSFVTYQTLKQDRFEPLHSVNTPQKSLMFLIALIPIATAAIVISYFINIGAADNILDFSKDVVTKLAIHRL